MTFAYEGPALNIDSAISVSCADVAGDVDAGKNVACGNIGGDVDAGNSVTCGNVEGNVDAGGSVICDDVSGNRRCWESGSVRQCRWRCGNRRFGQLSKITNFFYSFIF